MKTREWIKTKNCDWSGGHWVGLLLRAFAWSGNNFFLEEAQKKLPELMERIGDDDEFLGFIFGYSYAHLADMFHSDHYAQIALKAADRLIEMHNKKIGLIPLGSQCQIIGTKIKGSDLAGVDDAIIPNVLLFWAYDKTSDRKYLEVAIENLDRSIDLFMRNDGSTIHMIRFNPETGSIIEKWNNLGHDSSSTWSRGQAFFLLALAYGFNFTGKMRYRDTYSLALSFYLKINKKEDLTPYYDMADPDIPNVPIDTSSISILAESYLLMMKNGYDKYGLLKQIVNSLLLHMNQNKDSSVILGDGCFDYPRKVATNSELIFADYYFYDFLLNLREYIKGEKID
jgi:unsaturated chondroitin disaccharide hydrolase